MTVEIETKDTTSEKNDKRSSLLDKLKKASVIKETDVMSESKFFDDVEDIVTNVPAMNVALSGDLKKGFTTGLTVWAGPSKHFKTSFTLLMVKAYLDKYKNSICIFYDSEFGSPQSYFQSFGIDTSRVLHVPIANIEELKQDIAAQLVAISKGDKVIIAVDSVGNLASKKEVDDAIDQKTVADMTRAKQLKSLFRIVTPQLTIKKIPMIVVNHTYMEQGMYPKAIVSGGCLVAGQKIKMFDGSFKEVEGIVTGDTVDTLYGPKLVSHTWTPETLEFGEPECFEIEFEDGSKIECSNHHPFLVNGEWVDAEDLEVDMIVTTKK